MNQILVINLNNKNNKYKKFYLFLFYISVSISMVLIINIFSSHLIKINSTKIAGILKSRYNISTLYSSNNVSTSLKLYDNIYTIGLIEIPKISVKYPIIETTNNDLLKISVCKFVGPLPNRIGNLCIAGHNYKNKSMFSNLNKLNIGDSIFITDLNNTKLEYIVYNKFIVNETNLNCTKNCDNVEITLITCNGNNNSERIIVKAKMKGWLILSFL